LFYEEDYLSCKSVPKAQDKVCSMTRPSAKDPMRRSNLKKILESLFSGLHLHKTMFGACIPDQGSKPLLVIACYPLKHPPSFNNIISVI